MTHVSVVIPTRGRQSVVTAVRSALWQSLSPEEVIIVDSSGTGKAADGLDVHGPVRTIHSSTPVTAAAARWLGAKESRGHWVAFLDDDDFFAPSRLEAQLNMVECMRSNGAAEVVTSNFISMSYNDVVSIGDMPLDAVTQLFEGSRCNVQPKLKPGGDDDIIRYLFRRTTVRAKKRIVTSSILVEGSLARATPWRAGLTRFEDWDWLSRLTTEKRARWCHVDEPLVAISLGAPRSLSQGRVIPTLEHLLWPLESFADRPRELGDFLCCDVAVGLAKQADLRAACRIWKLSKALGKPGWQAQIRLASQIVASAPRGLTVKRTHEGVDR